MAAERSVSTRAPHLEPHAVIIKLLYFHSVLAPTRPGTEQLLAELCSRHEAALQLNLVTGCRRCPPAPQQGPVPTSTRSPSVEDDAEGARAAHARAAVGAEQKGGSPLAGAAPKIASWVSAKHPALQGPQRLPRALR